MRYGDWSLGIENSLGFGGWGLVLRRRPRPRKRTNGYKRVSCFTRAGGDWFTYAFTLFVMNDVITGRKTVAANFRAPRATPASKILALDLRPVLIFGSTFTILRRAGSNIRSVPTTTAAATQAAVCLR